MTAFDASHFERERERRGLVLGRPLRAVETTASTNDDAMAAARAGAAHGATFVADFQSAGRGRGGNRWQAAPGDALLCSVLLRPRLSLARAPLLTLGVGLAVRAAVASLDSRLDVGVKWPNDVWADGRKLAGILLESTSAGDRLSAIVVGVGLNVSTTSFPAELPSAVSLAQLGARTSREELLAHILAGIEARTATLEAGDHEAIISELRVHDVLIDRAIRVDGAAGVAKGFSSVGELLLQTATGLRPILAGHVELVS
ncbi:MAG: biotin--[acetyl-CoA-carboxylase] ligase [Polyangiaceae bacterium]